LSQARTSATCASDTTTTAAPGPLDPILKLLGGGGSSGSTTTLPACTEASSATSAPGTTATTAAPTTTTTTTTPSGGASTLGAPIPGGALPIPAPGALPVTLPSGVTLPGLVNVTVSFDPTNPLAPLCFSVQANEKSTGQQVGPLPVCIPI